MPIFSYSVDDLHMQGKAFQNQHLQHLEWILQFLKLFPSEPPLLGCFTRMRACSAVEEFIVISKRVLVQFMFICYFLFS